MSPDDAKWHWGKSNKYALEGAKSILIINGAASVSVLTFIGNFKPTLHEWYDAIIGFRYQAAHAILLHARGDQY
jgi:hypothetical protein